VDLAGPDTTTTCARPSTQHHCIHMYPFGLESQPSACGARSARCVLGASSRIHEGPRRPRSTTANTTHAFPAGPLRPNLIGDPRLPSDQQTPSHWFNTAAFVNPAPFAFGNSPRSVLRGPGIATIDLTLEKNIALTDAVKFDLRVEAHNLLNRANFNIPGPTLGAADFWTISSARPARTAQLGATLSF